MESRSRTKTNDGRSSVVVAEAISDKIRTWTGASEGNRASEVPEPVGSSVTPSASASCNTSHCEALGVNDFQACLVPISVGTEAG